VHGRRVLEIACGTGYWTAAAAQSAASIDAYDINQATLDIARDKRLGAHVRLAIGDAYAPRPGKYDCVLACFWWSHVPKSRIPAFTMALAAAAEPRARLILIDNAYAPGSSTPIARTDAQGNTYQQRLLADGSAHEVLKNFPDAAELRAALAPFCIDIAPEYHRHYWRLSASLKTRQEHAP